MTPESGIPQPESPEVAYARQLARARQNPVGAALAGGAVALVCAGVWAAISVAMEYQIGVMAIAIGFAVGLTVRRVGHGIDPLFAFMGAGLSLVGCVIGNLLTGCGFIAAQQQVGIAQVLAALDFEVAKELLVSTASPIDLLFYALAAYEGFRLSRESVSIPAATA